MNSLSKNAYDDVQKPCFQDDEIPPLHEVKDEFEATAGQPNATRKAVENGREKKRRLESPEERHKLEDCSSKRRYLTMAERKIMYTKEDQLRMVSNSQLIFIFETLRYNV